MSDADVEAIAIYGMLTKVVASPTVHHRLPDLGKHAHSYTSTQAQYGKCSKYPSNHQMSIPLLFVLVYLSF